MKRGCGIRRFTLIEIIAVLVILAFSRQWRSKISGSAVEAKDKRWMELWPQQKGVSIAWESSPHEGGAPAVATSQAHWRNIHELSSG